MSMKLLFHLKKLGALILLLGLTNCMYAQITVSGVITDIGDNSPLIGANVIVEGTTTGVATDIDGKYSISVPDGNAVLVISYLGYTTKNVPVNGQTTLNISLSEGIDFEEVVVVGYGGAKKKSDLTGSIASLSSEDFKAQPMTRVENALQGRTAGVQVSNTNGSPGNNAKIRIRGTNSITGSGSPLIVLDGIIGASLGAIDPNDIASMEVLKDASATALYGSRGSNGVILVTTKKGRKEGTQIGLSTFIGFQSLPKKIDIVNGADYARLINEQLAVGGSAPAFDEAAIAELETSGGTDWQDAIYRSGSEALTQNYTLSASGKKDKVGFYISGNSVNNDGILLNNHYKRQAFRSNLDFEINDRMTMGLNVTYSKEQALNGFISDLLFAPNAAAMVFDPMAPVFQADGVTPTKFSNYGSIAVSPMASALGREDERNTDNATITTFFNYKILDGLTYSFTGGVRDVNATSTIFVANYATTGATVANIYNSDFTQYQHTHVLEYGRSFADRHNLSVKGVFEEQMLSSYGSSSLGSGLLVEPLGVNNVGFASVQNIGSGTSAEGIRSYVGRVEYDFDNKILVTGTVRADGSSKFPEGNKYAVFPSIAVAWRLGQEDFIKNLGIFDDLKLRASYGQIGNQGISAYSSFALLQFGLPFNAVLDNSAAVTGVAPGRFANPNLKWETTTQLDIGVDFGFSSGRYRLGFDYYQKNTTDLLLNVSVPSFTGVSSILQNIGEVENKGFEIDLGAVIMDKEDLTWDVAFNFAANKTKVLDIGPNDAIFPGGGFAGSGSIRSRIEVGGELGNFLGYINEGTWGTDEETEAAVYGLQPGDTKYSDLNNDGVINGDDITIIGNGAPDFIWGLNNTVSYKNFELNVFLQSMMGHDIFNVQRAIMMGTSGDVKTPTHGDIANRWTVDNQNTDVPAFSSTNFQVPEDSRFIEDGTFVRLRNVRLGYNLPQDAFGENVFDNITVYISGQNLYTFTNYKGYDPEVSGSGNSNVDLGIDNGTYPNPRVVTIGLNAIF